MGNHLDLHPAVFEQLSSLERLDLTYNELVDLPSGVFDGLSNLRQLDLGGNQLNLRTGVFDGLSNLEYLKLYENGLSVLPPGTFAGLPNLERLDLGLANDRIPGGNELAELPSSAFTGLGRLRALWLNGNPGSPFPVELRLERRDTTDLAAPGPATLVVRVNEGAPFEMQVGLLATGATVTPNTVTIPSGATHSSTVTVAAKNQGSVTVTLGEPPEVPEARCSFARRFSRGLGTWSGSMKCYLGIQIATGDPMTLFR